MIVIKLYKWTAVITSSNEHIYKYYTLASEMTVFRMRSGYLGRINELESCTSDRKPTKKITTDIWERKKCPVSRVT